jgi:hypothetical protein
VRALQAMEEAEAMAAQRLAQAERLAPPAVWVAVAAAVAQHLAQVSAVRPTAVPAEEAAPDVVGGRQPAAEPAGAARRPEAAAVQDVVAAAQRRAAGPASVAVRLQVAEAPDAVAVLLRVAEAPDAVAVRLRVVEAPDAGVQPRGARDALGAPPLAAAWAGLPSTRRRGDRPVPSARGRSAHARGCLRTAQP